MKRGAGTVSRAGGAIERFIERTLAPRLEELAGEIRGLRGEMQQLDKRLGENATSLRNEMTAGMQQLDKRIGENMTSLRNEMQSEIRTVRSEIEVTRSQLNSRIDQVNTRIDALNGQVGIRIDARSQRLDDALNIRERLVAVEAKLAARNN